MVEIPAISRLTVDAMHELSPGALPWIDLASVLPTGARLNLDTTALPALCAPTPGLDPTSADPDIFPLDLVSATFLLLTRWEEQARKSEHDPWGSCRSSSSLGYRQRFLDRPVLDEWALVLREWIRRAFPRWSPRAESFRLFVSHDIDRPFKYKSWFRVLRAACGGLVLRRSVRNAFESLSTGLKSLLDWRSDPFYRSWMSLLGFNGELSTRAAFFLTTADPSRFDDGVDLSACHCQEILAGIRAAGHELAWHPGFRAAEDTAIFWKERGRAETIIAAPVFGARFHYLRWRVNHSWPLLADAGCAYDASLGYYDRPGFRCGTSQPFPVFDLGRGEQLPLLERPLVLMDTTVLELMKTCPEKAQRSIQEIIQRVRRVGGELSILIHNGDPEQTEQAFALFRGQLEGRASRRH